MKTPILFASQNKNKVCELKEIFKDSRYDIISLSQIGFKAEIEETETSFLGNAWLKALSIYNHFKVPVIADDSGLVVGKLNGEPGVYSARYAGESCNAQRNRDKLIKELKRYPEPWNATKVCAAVYYDGVNMLQAEGNMNGKIIPEEHGDNGWGYDHIFFLEEWGKTMAELSMDIRNRISHRSQAFKALIEKMDKRLIYG